MRGDMDYVRKSIEAQENAVIDVQFEIIRLLRESEITYEDLADRLGVSRARISQILSAGANPTIKTLAKIFGALDARLEICAGSTLKDNVTDHWGIGRFDSSGEKERNHDWCERVFVRSNEEWARENRSSFTSENIVRLREYA